MDQTFTSHHILLYLYGELDTSTSALLEDALLESEALMNEYVVLSQGMDILNWAIVPPLDTATMGNALIAE